MTIMLYIIHKVDTVSTYTITFSDALSGNECGSASISAASCIGGICSHDFEVPSESHQSNCNSDINVTVSTAKLVQSESLKIGASLYTAYVLQSCIS